jgi:hypothetical protein
MAQHGGAMGRIERRKVPASASRAFLCSSAAFRGLISVLTPCYSSRWLTSPDGRLAFTTIVDHRLLRRGDPCDGDRCIVPPGSLALPLSTSSSLSGPIQVLPPKNAARSARIRVARSISRVESAQPVTAAACWLHLRAPLRDHTHREGVGEVAHSIARSRPASSLRPQGPFGCTDRDGVCARSRSKIGIHAQDL